MRGKPSRVIVILALLATLVAGGTQVGASTTVMQSGPRAEATQTALALLHAQFSAQPPLASIAPSATPTSPVVIILAVPCVIDEHGVLTMGQCSGSFEPKGAIAPVQVGDGS